MSLNHALTFKIYVFVSFFSQPNMPYICRNFCKYHALISFCSAKWDCLVACGGGQCDFCAQRLGIEDPQKAFCCRQGFNDQGCVNALAGCRGQHCCVSINYGFFNP